MRRFLILNIIFTPLIFGETQNGEFQKALHEMASEMKGKDASRVVDTDLKNIPIPMVHSVNVPTAKPTTCENTALLLKLLDTLLELLSKQNFEFGKDQYILTLMKKYLDDAPETPERNDMINKIKNIEANMYKKPTEEALRNLYQPRTQILFKTDIPKINQQTCKQTLENLIQNAYNTYLQLSTFPMCQQTGQYSNVNLGYTHRPQDLSFDIKVLSPIEFQYHQQLPNKDANLFYTHVNLGPSNDLMKYLQSQGFNKNLDIKSILQNYRPGQKVSTGNSNLPNNEAPVMNMDSQNKPPLYPPNNFAKEPLNSPVLDLTKVYNPNNQKSYIYLTPDNSVNAKLIELFNNRNDKKPNEVQLQNLQLPVNEWKPPQNIIFDSINNQTLKHPTLNEIAQFLQEGKNNTDNPFSNNSNSPLNTNFNVPDTLVTVPPNNVNNENNPSYSLHHIIPKENEAVLNPNTNLNPSILALLNKYLPKNNNGQFIVRPNVSNLDELAKLLPKDLASQKYLNNNNSPVIDSVTFDKLVGLLPKELLHSIFPNLIVPNHQTPDIYTSNLPNGNNPYEQTNRAPDANSLGKILNLLPKDLINKLNPNVNNPNTDQGNVNIQDNPGINNNQNTNPYFDNNKYVVSPNFVLNPNVNPNTLPTTNYVQPNNPQWYPGPEANKLQVPDLQRLMAVTNLLKLNPKPNTAGIIELTYLLKRPKPLIYQPYYYVKYKLPYVTFINNLSSMMRNKPYLRSNPAQLYHELISHSNVTDLSPDLKGFGKEDILQLVLKEGALVNAKILNGNDTFLNEQLKNIQKLNSGMQPEDLLKLHNDNIKQNQTLSNNNGKVSVPSDSVKTNNNEPIQPNLDHPGNFYNPVSMFNRNPLFYNTPLPFYPLQAANPTLG